MKNLKITIVHNSDIKEVEGLPPSTSFIDERTLKGKKEGASLRRYWGSRQCPFIICYNEDNKPIKAFYSETGEDVIDSLVKYLNI